MAEKHSVDEVEADLYMNLEEFVTKYNLPHFARVKEGVYEAYTEKSLEISNGELLELYRVVYPLTVTLDFVHSTSGTKQTVSMSTMNDDLRFHVLTRKEKPLVYPTIAEVIKEWPLMVKCKTDDTNKTGSVVDGDVLRRPAFQKNDELRLVRKMWDDDKKLVLECKDQSTKQLIRLPASDVGQFFEMTDPKSYTLQELIDIALVERRLKIDQLCKCKPISLKGIPRDYSGTLHLSKPLVQVQVSRLLQGEYSSDFTVTDPFLVPIDCGIVLSPRDETYQQKPSIYKTYTLSSLIETSTFKYPSVARVVSWKEQSGFLQNHLIRPGDYLVFYKKRSVNWILAHNSLDKYFLIPITNRGKFVCNRSKSQLKLDLLEQQAFPISVQFSSDTDSTVEVENLSLDAFIKDEPCVLACKIFGDRVGTAFHLPLRTKIRVLPAEWRGERLPKDPTRFSTYDDSVEEIPANLYEEIMDHPSNPRSRPKGSATVPVTQSKKPPLPLPILKERKKATGPTSEHEYLTPVEAVAGLSQPSDQVYANYLPQKPSLLRKASNAARKEDWHPPCLTRSRSDVQKEANTGYENVSVTSVPPKTTARRPPPSPSYENHMITSGTQSQDTINMKPTAERQKKPNTGYKTLHTHRPGVAEKSVEIPKNGNIVNFTASEMSQFLRQKNVPSDVITVWNEKRITGREFARMSDDQLHDYGLDNAVIIFFRNGSRLQQSGLDCL